MHLPCRGSGSKTPILADQRKTKLKTIHMNTPFINITNRLVERICPNGVHPDWWEGASVEERKKRIDTALETTDLSGCWGTAYEPGEVDIIDCDELVTYVMLTIEYSVQALISRPGSGPKTAHVISPLP